MKYKYILQNYQFVVNKDSPFFWWAIPAAMAAGSAISALSSSSANDKNVEAQERINKQNIENQWKMFGAQNVRQDYLNANQALIHRQSLQRAGININSDFGGFPNVSTNAITNAESKAPIVNPILPSDLGVQMAQMIQQTPLVEAQARKTNADADAQEILNDRERSVDKGINKFIHDNLDTGDVADLEGIEVKGGNGITYNKGTLQAQQLTREWQSRLKELDKNDIRNVLEKLVTEEQLKDNRTVQALRDMPYYELQRLSREIDVLIKQPDVMDSVISYNFAQAHNADTQSSLNELEEEITRNTNINELIHKYLGDGALADFAQVFVMIVGALTGNMRFGANVSSFKGKVKSSSKVYSTSNNHNTNHNINYSGD